eukprot:m.69758 g.69758  ORF g.69758 m.69758 type:complete len:526 (-) comp12848_c0_seq2:38-1615(-)
MEANLAIQEVKNKVIEHLLSQGQLPSDMQAACLKAISELGLEVHFKNVIHQTQKRGTEMGTTTSTQGTNSVLPAGIPLPYSPTEPFDFMRAAQLRWWQQVSTRLSVLATTNNAALATPRAATTYSSAIASLVEAPLKRTMFVYDPTDLAEQLTKLANPNFVPEGLALRQECSGRAHARRWWGRIQVQFRVKSTSELRVQFAALESRFPQIGVEDQFVSGLGPDTSFVDARYARAQQVLSSHDSAAAQAFCCQGCPTALRADIWAAALCDQEDWEACASHYDRLQEAVTRHELLIDKLLLIEIKNLCDYDDNYFVFYTTIRDIMLALTRDTRVAAACGVHRVRAATSGGEASVVDYPPGGLIPFRGCAFYAAPICFLAADPPRAYELLRQMYTRYFSLLHTITSHTQGLPRLCRLFESLLHTHQPHLCRHLQAISCDHLAVVVPWLVQAFAGFLEPLQVMLLWDRIVGFDSLEPLAVLAAAIFAFRKQKLLACASGADALRVLGDLRGLMVVPLLQHCLFPRPDSQ